MTGPARHVAPVLLALALVAASIGHLYTALARSEARNAAMHAASMLHRERLDAENKASMRDRARIADQLEQLEHLIREARP
jgi:ATP-dependent protease ClpP protease subunit